jgi:glutamate carboxypeptidase
MQRSLRRRSLAFILLAAAASRAPGQGNNVALSTAERAVVRAVDSENARTLALLQRVVDINSGTMNFTGVRQVGDVLRAEFDSLGFATRWVDGAPFHRAGHLVAEHRGRGPKLLLIGHLDTVFEPSSPFQRFELLADSMARGPGVIDMKGGDVIIVAALRALRAAGLLDELDVTVVYDGDEEDAGAPLSEARRALMDAARGAIAAIGFEDGPGDPHVAVIARRGDESWTLRATGTPAHSSQIFQPEVGAGAVYEVSRVLSEFYRQLAGRHYLTFNPGLALGGTAVRLDSTGISGSAEGKTNVVAERMTVTGDLRTISPEQLAAAKRVMQAIVAKHLPHTDAELTFDPGYPPMAPTAGNRRLLATYDHVSRELGLWPVTAADPAKAGAADVSFVAALVPMKIDGVGLSGHDDHTTKETADLRMLSVQTKRAALLLHRLTTKPADASDR